jgi:TPR repeat protein
MEWYLKAAEKGGPAAMFAISEFYSKGRGVAANAQDAVKWAIKAALNGLPLAQREMGKRYRVGKDVNKDTIVAQSWFTRAALAGDAESALTVADMLTTGEGGLPPDPKTAKSILTRAAELGMVEAQLKLAEYHEKGLDGRPDLIRAYALALATGENENGKKMRDALEKKMTKEQVEQGKKEYDRLKAMPAKQEDKAAKPAEGEKKTP